METGEVLKTRSEKIKYITATGMMAALITIMTAYICHIPVGTNGGYVHFGDSLIYLAAVLLPRPYAFAAAAIGGGVADLLTAPAWAPATIIIKMLITLPFTNKSKKIINTRNIIATVIAFLISGISYFLAEYLIFGTWTALLDSVSGTMSALVVSMSASLVQSGGSAIFFILFGIALDKSNIKQKLFHIE